MRHGLAPGTPAGLAGARKSQKISQREAAGIAGVSQQAFAQYERGEANATITLECLQRAAAAVGHEVVYFLRPLANGTVAPAKPVKRAKRRRPPAMPPPSKAPDLPVQIEEEPFPVNLL